MAKLLKHLAVTTWCSIQDVLCTTYKTYTSKRGDKVESNERRKIEAREVIAKEIAFLAILVWNRNPSLLLLQRNFTNCSVEEGSLFPFPLFLVLKMELKRAKLFLN
ncbi:hypothetical protein CEXT_294601 [Caerostris extrusa]|uniref:Secreted protein n=1 Tax=Caerostris extrusa TaxID=172846 RepID=A0AAV4RQZ1_CAEEX|nr:hypothetical protein CEXT_294601 [Caerostris extrusa]